MTSKSGLRKADSERNDEYYTQISDIEKELFHYKDFFENKTILCNCDDPRVSNFFRFFALNFNNFKLKRLITTCYKNQDADLFSQHNCEKAVWIDYRGNPNDSTSTDFSTIEIKQLNGDGDFRSQECIEILKQADIVVTNPPFSLFREYLGQLMKYEKNFLIIGNVNAITYKEVFPLIRDNKLWLGPSISSGDRKFNVPDDYPLYAAGCGIDPDGRRFIRVKGVRWFTNLDHNKRHEELDIVCRYSPEEYPHYDNYDAIDVGKTADIPCDYNGAMGVPITFLDKYNPEQFDIIKFRKGDDDKDLRVNGKCPYFRILIRNKHPQKI